MIEVEKQKFEKKRLDDVVSSFNLNFFFLCFCKKNNKIRKHMRTIVKNKKRKRKSIFLLKPGPIH
jgi:hypothetical protein